MTNWNKIVFEYICPSIGILISTALYSAPVKSLATALERRSLGALNPTPWGIMTGNCFGWIAYAYYSSDPFVLASNIPGLLVSFWLNAGASKLQYYAEVESRNESNTGSEEQDSRKKGIVFTPQDKLMLGVLSLWMTILVGVGWLGLGVVNGREKEIVGIFVNINLLFFYGAPLQTMKTVLVEKRSDSIHTPTMILNCTNAAFWGAYGIAINNIVIYGPNGIGMLLGLGQAALCCLFPKGCNQLSPTDVDDTPLLDPTDDDDDDDSELEVDEGVSVVQVVPVSQII